MTETAKLILVEDDTEISRLTCMLLESEGYQVTPIYDGNEAVESIRNDFNSENQPDLVILDIMLPGLNGIEICEQIRDFYDGPVLMLTGSNDDINELISFKKGADDYVTKPFKPTILVARIQALLRRSLKSATDNDNISTGNLVIHLKRRECFLSEQRIELTSSEFDLLALLANNLGNTVSREQCCDALRGFSYDGLDRSIDMKISALRKKIPAQTGEESLIKTVRGKGYMLALVPTQ